MMRGKEEHDRWLRSVEAELDDELDPNQAVTLRAELASDPEAQQVREALLELRSLVRAEVDQALEQTQFSRLWPRIEEQLEAEAALHPLDLQAFADGELHGRELGRAAAAVGRSAAAQGRLEAVAELGEMARLPVTRAAEQADFGQLWLRLERSLEAEAAAAARVPVRRPAQAAEPGFWQRLLQVLGGPRTVLACVATAAILLAVLLPGLVSNGDETDSPQPLEIRVVHVNETRAAPGYEVTVDSNEGVAPVIFIRPDQSQAPNPERPPIGDPHAPFHDPI